MDMFQVHGTDSRNAMDTSLLTAVSIPEENVKNLFVLLTNLLLSLHLLF